MPTPPRTPPAVIEPTEEKPAPTEHREKAEGSEIQARFDEAHEKGFFGEKVDDQPNSTYSQEGGMPGTN